ncbi:Leucine-rich repeat serine/threonine-protein kinase 2 [Phytophthora pseudosyringae]|uniref:Leucine-rich repeat serine/threonine-protein kinase 2 n=1 Tax=Phytophthora pseudosyringae TaxID=221518 RepID=A0A8T1VR88_9STRA|nr:Leucine-rich repeat serine/threonine-protein kinase 2 [Phytophthora pseudosyringae]
MQGPVAPNVTMTSHQAVDADLMEALGYFSEDLTTPAQVSSSPLIVGTGGGSPKLSEADSTDEAMDSMLLSLEIQKLLPSDEQDKGDKVSTSVSPSESPIQPDGQQPSSPKKMDRRLKPYSTCKRRNRRRPKHELEYLRAKVAELQEELETLGKADEGSVRRQETALATIDSKTDWKERAERQKHEVDNSLAENRNLRDRLLGQLHVARVLEAAIEQQQKEASVSCHGSRDKPRSFSFCRVGRPPLVTTLTDEQVFDRLNSNLQTQLAEVDAVLTTNGLSSVLHNLQGGFEFKREATGMSFRHEEARLLPFPWQALHHAIWDSLHTGLVVKDTEARVLDKDHSNLIFRDTLELGPKSHRIRITKRAAFRRHIEQDRVVFIWNSYVQIDGSVSVCLREKGWSTASTFEFHRDVTPGADSSRNVVRGCITRMAIQLIPEVSEFQSEREAQMHVGEVTDLIVGTYHHNFGLVHEVAEDLLLSNGGEATTSNAKSGKGCSFSVLRM